MSVARPELAAIDASIVRGRWWTRLFHELSHRGVGRAEELTASPNLASRRFLQELEHVVRAVRLAVTAAMGLGRIVRGLADLRAGSAVDIAAARARALAKAEAEAAARERTAARAEAAREARDAEDRPREADRAERDRPEPRERDPLVEALAKRLDAVDPAIVDFDDLALREMVVRICADLGITPDWERWEAGDWMASGTPAPAPAAVPTRPPPPNPAQPQAAPTPPRRPARPPPRSSPAPALPGLPAFTPPTAETALPRVFQSEPGPQRWRLPRRQ